MDKAAERLLARKRSTESEAEFAERIGVSQQKLSSWKLGKHPLSRESAETICERMDWSLDWLLMGRTGETDAFEQGVAEAKSVVKTHVERMAEDLDGLQEDERAERMPMRPTTPDGDGEQSGRESA